MDDLYKELYRELYRVRYQKLNRDQYPNRYSHKGIGDEDSGR